jgi:predicted Zn-dependent peptidase
MGAPRPAFDRNTYEIERENLIRYIQSNIEDKGYYASQQMQKLFYGDSDLGLSSLGTIELLKGIQPEETYDYYQDMLVTNGLDIMVVGQVDEAEVTQLVREKLPFTDRDMTDPSVYREQDVPAPLKTLIEEKPYNQSIFQEIYTVPARYGVQESIDMQVMSGLLGGFAHSKLFINVREKASLAYYADSTYDAFLGIIRIKAGIDAKNYDQARDLIAQQIKAMQAGDFTDQDLAITKEMIINAIEQSLDSQYTFVVHADLKAITGDRFLTTQKRIAMIQSVTRDQVIAAAQALTPAAMYLLKGVGNA